MRINTFYTRDSTSVWPEYGRRVQLRPPVGVTDDFQLHAFA